jgi:hypothetical protein
MPTQMNKLGSMFGTIQKIVGGLIVVSITLQNMNKNIQTQK